MKNLKKLLAVIVTVAMLATFSIPVLAEDVELTDAEKCETLGMLKGTGDGVTEEYLATAPMRYQAAIMFLRLKGLEDEALAYTGEDNFSDAGDVSATNQKILAYLKANDGLGFSGYPDGTFKPLQEMTAKEYYKVLLVALGYVENVDFAWANVLPFAASKGLLAVADADPFTVGDLAAATVEALQADVADGSDTLINTLIAGGFVSEEDADAAGLYVIPATPVAVVSISAENLKEIQVVFNKALDEDTVDVDNFQIDGAAPKAASLADDGVTVTLTVADAAEADNGGSYTVTVEAAVTDTEGVAMEEYEETVTVIDSTLPLVTGIELTGPRTFDLTFSEPIETKPTVKVKDGIYGCTVGAAGTNKVTVTLAASSLPEGDYSVKVSAYKDFAELTGTTETLTLAYVKDATEPTAEVTAASQTEVTVKFNKAVKLTDPGVEYFYHTYSAYAPTSVTPVGAVNGYASKYTLEFAAADNPIPEGTTNLVIRYKGATGGTKIKDEWGNTLSANIVIPVTVEADSTAPAVDGDVDVDNEKTIKITFTEAVTDGDVKANFVIEDGDGDEVDIDTIAYAAKVTTITFADELNGEYTITISGVTDTSLSENAIVEVTLPFVVGDETAPDPADFVGTCIENTTADKTDLIYVDFGEKMSTDGQYSVLDADNYLLNNVALPDDTTLEIFGSAGQVVLITLPDASAQAVNGINLTIARVADLAGNKMVALAHNEALVLETAPAVTAIKQKSANEIEFTVNKVLQSALPDAFDINVGGDTYNPATVDLTLGSGKSTILVTLSAETVNALKAVGATYGTDTGLIATALGTIGLDGEFIVSETGMEAADDVNLAVAPGTAVTPADVWVPEYVSAVYTNAVDSTIALTFSENLYDVGTTENLYAQDLVVKDEEGDQLVAQVDYTTAVVGKVLTITITGVANIDDYTVDSAATIVYIKDAAGNKVATFDGIDKP